MENKIFGFFIQVDGQSKGLYPKTFPNENTAVTAASAFEKQQAPRVEGDGKHKLSTCILPLETGSVYTRSDGLPVRLTGDQLELLQSIR